MTDQHPITPPRKPPPLMKYNATSLVARESADSTALLGTLLADCNDIEKLCTIAENLWSLLDDIDTASDMFKPSDEAGYRRFYQYAMKKAMDRKKHLVSTGFHLYLPTTETTDD